MKRKEYMSLENIFSM